MIKVIGKNLLLRGGSIRRNEIVCQGQKSLKVWQLGLIGRDKTRCSAKIGWMPNRELALILLPYFDYVYMFLKALHEIISLYMLQVFFDILTVFKLYSFISKLTSF